MDEWTWGENWLQLSQELVTSIASPLKAWSHFKSLNCTVCLLVSCTLFFGMLIMITLMVDAFFNAVAEERMSHYISVALELEDAETNMSFQTQS